MIGLITGSGFYDIPELTDREVRSIDTPFGGPVTVTVGGWRGQELCFVARHAANHSIPPHAINYRANIAALFAMGVTDVVATAVSGSMNPSMEPGDLVVISDFLNFTSGRDTTFFDGSRRPIVEGGPPPAPVIHTDMTNPYDPELRGLVLRAAAAESIPVHDGAVYCTADGPRFETPAEIRMMSSLGGDLVGMTGYPEVALAVEVGMRYASIGVVSNLAAGISPDRLSAFDIMDLVERLEEPLYRLMGRTVEMVGAAGPRQAP